MLLTIHLASAFASLLYVGFLFARPSQSRFYVAYSLVAFMIGTGVALIFLKRPEHLSTICLEGLFFLTLLSVGIIAARVKFRKQVLESVSKKI